MPHKRAKRSTREERLRQREDNLAPEKSLLKFEAVPKSVARVLNADKIRREWKLKKRQLELCEGTEGTKRRRVHVGDNEDDHAGRTPQLKILPGESIQHFNRRVEDDVRPIVRSAITAARAAIRRTHKEEAETRQRGKACHVTKKPSSPPRTLSRSKSVMSAATPTATANARTSIQIKDFPKISTDAPRRLNDIIQAPPELTAFPRAVKNQNSCASRKDKVHSVAQRLMMDKEREDAIRRYRLFKASRAKMYGRGAGDPAT